MDTNIVNVLTEILAKNKSSYDIWVLVLAALAPTLAALVGLLNSRVAVAGIREIKAVIIAKEEEKAAKKEG